VATLSQTLDRWQRKALEVSLAGQLSDAREAQRLARTKYQDHLAEVSILPATDGNLRLRQLFAAHQRAQREHLAALEKWVRFVRASGQLSED
jgi:hypothetical protein